MSDLYHNYYHIEGITDETSLVNVATELTKMHNRDSEFYKNNHYTLQFGIQLGDKQRICLDDEITCGFIAKCLSEMFPDHKVTYISENEFDPADTSQSEWINGECVSYEKDNYKEPEI